MAVTTTKTNKPINPRGDDKSPLAFNRAKIYSGKALDFDGVNDYVEVPYNADTRPTSEITLSAIVKLDDWNLSVFERVISCTEAGGWHIANGEGSYIPTQNTGMLIRLSSSGYVAVYVSNDILKDEYNHLTTTFDGRYLKMYVNGVLSATTDSGTTQTITYAVNNSIYIGAEAGGGSGTPSGNYIDGQISNAKVFDVALTATQVSDLYNNPEKIVPTGVSNDALKLWLPMMEGAGTTAYDGSGNGNHGTISGATWTQGVGAPVAQTAIIDWNKGTNNLIKTDDYTNTTYWNSYFSTASSSSLRVPNADEDAFLLTEDSGTNRHGIFNKDGLSISANDTYTMSVFAKAGTRNHIFIDHYQGTSNYTWFDLSTGTVGTKGSGVTASIRDVGDGWYQCVATKTTVSTSSVYIGVYLSTGDGVSSYAGDSGTVYLYGLSITQGSNATYVPNPTTTSITTPVLLPQGLTTGRDITGVNLFENVRKQYALNLDGQSWAEVHDNESLDFGTGSFTLEAWVKAAYIDTGSSYNVILNLGNTLGVSAGLTSRSGYIAFFYGTSSLNYSTSNDGSWVHIVGTYDGTNTTIYANGVEESQTARTAINVSTDETKYIGKDSNITRIYKDQIAQPRIYNRALTADEVEQNYNAGKNTYS